MGKRQWYKIITLLAHQGAGRDIEIDFYMWVKNPVDAMLKYKNLKGIKRNKIPNIKPLNREESSELEYRISEDGLSLHEAKRSWYTTYEEYKWWHNQFQIQHQNVTPYYRSRLK